MHRTLVALTALATCSLCGAEVLTVDDDGPADFTTIAAALEVANPGDTILVRAGTYAENGLAPSGGITIEGEVDAEGLPATMIDGEGQLVMQFSLHADEQAVVRNLRVTSAESMAFQFFHSKPTIINCTFTGCGKSDAVDFTLGGAMYNLNGAPVLIDCRFFDNFGGQGGAFATWESGPGELNHPYFLRCTFRGNTGRWGGAMSNMRSNPTLVECVFENNTALVGGGAIYNEGFDEPDFWLSRPIIESCVFTGNSTPGEGGAILNQGSSESTLIDCRLSGNSASLGGGIMNNGSSFSILTNTIACDNLPEQITGSWNDEGENWIGVACPPLPNADLNGDGSVDGVDLATLLSDWNCTGPVCIADLNQDGQVGGADLTILLGEWGPRPG